MKNFPVGLISALLSAEARVYMFLDMNLVSTTERYTDMDIPFLFNGNVYTPNDLSIGHVSAGMGMTVQSMDIKIQNVNQYQSSFFLNNEQRGRICVLRLMVLDSNRSQVAVLPVFRGLIDDWKMGDLHITIILKNELILWKKKTLRKSSALCPWSFKGTECGYSGTDTTCDRTYNRCVALSNEANFGGFRWIPSVMEKEIQWGPK